MAEPTDDQVKEITDALLAGRKIEAIKVYREATGSGLKESKEFIEGLTETLRERHPDRFPEKKAGCAPILLLTGALAVLLTTALERLLA